MSSPPSRLARLVLMLHGLVTIASGLYSFYSPSEFQSFSGGLLDGMSNQGLQTFGMADIAIGWYQFLFAYQGNRRLIAGTIPMRLGFAGVMLSWGKTPFVVYEGVVAWMCGIALFM